MWERLVSFSWATFASSLSIFECSAEQRFNLNANFWLDFFTARVYVQRTKVVYLIHLRPFGTCKVNWHFKKKIFAKSATFCMENPQIPGRIQMEWFIPVEIFRKKSNTFRGITFFPFLPKRPKFSGPFVWITRARLQVERKRKIYRYFVNGTTQSHSCFRCPKKWQYHLTELFFPKFPFK